MQSTGLQSIGLERFDWTDSIGPIRLDRFDCTGGVQRGCGDGRRRGGDGAARAATGDAGGNGRRRRRRRGGTARKGDAGAEMVNASKTPSVLQAFLGENCPRAPRARSGESESTGGAARKIARAPPAPIRMNCHSGGVRAEKTARPQPPAPIRMNCHSRGVRAENKTARSPPRPFERIAIQGGVRAEKKTTRSPRRQFE